MNVSDAIGAALPQGVHAGGVRSTPAAAPPSPPVILFSERGHLPSPKASSRAVRAHDSSRVDMSQVSRHPVMSSVRPVLVLMYETGWWSASGKYSLNWMDWSAR